MKALIAASGSGGHLFPAVYIAQALKELRPDTEITFVGSGRPLEERILSSAGSKVLNLPVQGLKNRGFKGLLQFICSLPQALLQTAAIFRSERPDIVIGVGGYVTFLPVVFARLKNLPSWIHEAELKPGLANYVLSFFASKISVALEEAVMPSPKKVVFTGHPVRRGIEGARSFEPLKHDPQNVLILGGSQGAQALDSALPALATLITEHNLKIIHQCRKDNVEKVKQAYSSAQIEAEIVSFIDDMTTAYNWADIIISRSGAGSVMEIGIVNKPAVLVPFPHAQGDHQKANAMILVNDGKAFLCEEGPQFLERIRAVLEKVLDLQIYNQMKLSQGQTRTRDAAKKIAEGCLELIR